MISKKDNKFIIFKYLFIFLLSIFIFKSDTQILNDKVKQKIINTFSYNEEKNNYVDGYIIIKLKNEKDIKSIENNIISYENLGNSFFKIHYDESIYNKKEIIELLNNNEELLYAEPEYKFKIDSSIKDEQYYTYQWGLSNSEYGINLYGVDDLNSDKDVVVAVIDTGINLTHNDLKNQLWTNSAEIPNNGIDEDGNGLIDDYNGWNFFANNNNVSDTIGHGSHVSGIIAGEKNGAGIVGVNNDAKIMTLKVSNADGEFALSDVIKGINYALSKGVKIFNFSFGTEVYIESFKEVLEESNAIFICSAGNGGTDEIGDDNDALPFYPASYDLSNIISVAAIDKDGKLAGFSNYGKSSVDIAAPGEDVLSSHLGSNYYYMSGTSMAAPFVTGVASVLYLEDNTKTIVEIKNAILNSAKNNPDLIDKIKTNGILDFSTSYYNYLNLISFDGGIGTEEDPYLISSSKQFDAIRNNMNAYYKLTKDINLKYDINDQNMYNDSIGWEPIGNLSNPFLGNIDGNGHIISNVKIIKTNQDNIGLFGYLGNDVNPAIIKNLSISHFDVTGRNNVGSLLGYGYNASVENVFAYGKLNVSGNNVGGIVGNLNGSIENSMSLGILNNSSSSFNVGGIVGNLNGNILTSLNMSFINSGNDVAHVGFLVGALNGNIYNSYYINPYNIRNNELGKLLPLENISNISSYSGFDFINKWILNENDSFPNLKNFELTHITSLVYPKTFSLDIGVTNQYIIPTIEPNTINRSLFIYSSSDKNVLDVNKEGKLIIYNTGKSLVNIYSLETKINYSVEVIITKTLKGDINFDGLITMTDLVNLRRYIAGTNDIRITVSNCDLNGDSSVTLTDLIKLRRYIAGLEDL